MNEPTSDRLLLPTESERENSVWTMLSVWRRYWRVSILACVVTVLLVHCAQVLRGAWQPVTYEAKFEVQYRSGGGVMAGLSRLVGSDLPSLQKNTVETQREILASETLTLAALRRVQDFGELPEERLLAVQEDLHLDLVQRPNTNIIVVTITGSNRQHVQEYAEGLLAEYHARDVRTKRAKDTELFEYIREQIVVQEEKVDRIYQVLSAHRETVPLEAARDQSRKRVEEAERALGLERQRRRGERDDLLGPLTSKHPLVREAEEAVQVLETISDATTAAELKAHQGGAESRWVGLKRDVFVEQANQQELERKIREIRERVGEQFRGVLRATSDPEYVKREYRFAQETYEGLRRRLGQVELSIHDTSSDVDILVEPKAKTTPRSRSLSLSLVLGLLCGLLAPFVLDSLIVTFRTVEDVERVTGLPSLGCLPLIDEGETNGLGILLPGTSGSDQIRLLRTNIEATLDYPSRRLILISGAEPAEGKSLIAANLASAYSELGVPTLLVDLDLRRPVAHEIFRVDRTPGMVEVVRDGLPWERAIQIPETDNLHVLPAGNALEDSAGLLASVRLAEVLGELRQTFSVVICDTPALAAVADASLFARAADAIAVVCALTMTPQRSLARAINTLRTTRANVIGFVANDPKGSTGRPRYGTYYGSRTEVRPRRAPTSG